MCAILHQGYLYLLRDAGKMNFFLPGCVEFASVIRTSVESRVACYKDVAVPWKPLDDKIQIWKLEHPIRISTILSTGRDVPFIPK